VLKSFYTKGIQCGQFSISFYISVVVWISLSLFLLHGVVLHSIYT